MCEEFEKRGYAVRPDEARAWWAEHKARDKARRKLELTGQRSALEERLRAVDEELEDLGEDDG
jgi:hypothetical protein